MFQPTHPHGVRPPVIYIILRPSWFQPTHPHGVRRKYSDSLLMFLMVSTHAPARGATSIRTS